MAETILYLVIGFTLFEFIFSKTLSWLNMKTWDKPLPPEVKDLYDAEEYKKARDYAVINNKIGTISATLTLAITVSILYFKGFASVDNFARSYSASAIVQCLIFFGILSLASSIISLPFELYSTFVVEEKFGFNKTTPLLYVIDKLKILVIAIVVGGGILALLTFLFGLLGNNFWMAGWALVSVIMILTAMFSVNVLLPIFNKLVPLEEGELRSSIEKYAAQVKFPLTNILIMDGSKRSSKSNAFFSGLGHKKNIVLYDTLIQDMSINEITAVLAHEVGHYKHNHVLQIAIISTIQIAILFFVFGVVAKSSIMAEMLGAKQNSFHLSLVTFSLLYAPVSLITDLLMNLFSRKNEYEADAYAQKTYSAAPLISALRKLTVKHLGNLQPHKAYVFFNYSHPTFLQRMNAMKGG